GRFGNDPLIGRKLDMGMCFVLGLLPHVVLLTFLPDSDKNEGLYKYLELSLDLINHYGWMVKAARIPLVAFGVGYTFFYIQCYLRFSKKGYQVSWPKLLLFASTGATTILTASFFTIADGIFFGIFITPYNTTLSYSSASAQILPISRD
ncbi:MAG: hypothetical protein ACXVCE_16885, partial [Bacteriovorax sp.]